MFLQAFRKILVPVYNAFGLVVSPYMSEAKNFRLKKLNEYKESSRQSTVSIKM